MIKTVRHSVSQHNIFITVQINEVSLKQYFDEPFNTTLGQSVRRKGDKGDNTSRPYTASPSQCALRICEFRSKGIGANCKCRVSCTAIASKHKMFF